MRKEEEGGMGREEEKDREWREERGGKKKGEGKRMGGEGKRGEK